MSAAKKKKLSSLYDQFYGKWPDEHEKQVNKTMKSFEEQMKDYALRLDTMLKENRNNANTPTTNMITFEKDLNKIRDTIRKGAKKDATVKITSQKTNTPVISDVVQIKNIENFTNETHDVFVRLKYANYYSEQITTKIVGMENVDWWEYVLIYGFFKSLMLGYEYTKVKDYINGVQSTRTVSGQNLEIIFIPKKNDVKQNFDTLNGQTVIRETGIIYDSATICLEVPQKGESKTEEYRKGYFVYEDSFTNLVIDYDALAEKIEQMLIDSKLHPTLIQEIIKILNNGRLSTI